MQQREIKCGCEFGCHSAELFVQHMVETGHGMDPEFHADLVASQQVRDELVASLIAIATCNSPEEIGAEPVE